MYLKEEGIHLQLDLPTKPAVSDIGSGMEAVTRLCPMVQFHLNPREDATNESLRITFSKI